MSISSVLDENFGALRSLPALSSISFNFLLSSSKEREQEPQKTRFKKSSPSKPSAGVLCIEEESVFSKILLNSKIAKSR
jgi:hypothetical protein